ncbi:MAG TPA: homoserine O-acetyltransferase [Steroidobacteraceae bacterium]|nr:homoserine O-acetyltransferase [Steroidobacteraceae bacterium]
MSARRIVRLDRPFPMRLGGTLRDVDIAYETWGELSAARDNALLIFTGLSPSAHAASSPEDPAPGWWEDMVGPGRPIDTHRWFVICINSLGSCFGSTGPASKEPETGELYRLRFPVLTVEDIARGGFEVLRSLGLETVAVVVGPSLGGMTAHAFCAQFPGAARTLLSISAAARSTPFAIALRSLQREMIRRDPAWEGGQYPPGSGPVTGMRLARKLGMITYRSAAEWQVRFGRERAPQERRSGDPFGIDFEIEGYLEVKASRFVGQFDPNCYLYISRAMDLFDLSEHGGSVVAALKRSALRQALVIGVETDLLFPLASQREIAEGLEQAGVKTQFSILPSIQGHDSFLVDMERFRPAIGDFLAKLPDGARP